MTGKAFTILTVALCLDTTQRIPQANAFMPQPVSSATKRKRPLHSFEVMTTFEAASEVSQASAAFMSSTLNNFFQTQPYLAAFLTCSFKASAADIIAQTQEVPKIEDSSTKSLDDDQLVTISPRVDVSRNLGFLFYGGIYQGMAQNYLYNVLYASWFGSEQSLEVITKEVVVDNLIFAPLLCLPIAYAFKTVFTSDELSIDVFRRGLEKYADDVTTRGLLVQYWKIWIPAQFLTFGVIPSHFRVAFVAAVSFFWIFILSTISSSASNDDIQVSEYQETQVS